MRIGEVIRLDRDDVDWAAHLLVVHVGKNASGAKTARGTQAASGTLSKKGLAP